MADNAPLTTLELEQAFDLIAEAIDEVGPEHETKFLAKLALMLSHQLGAIDRVATAIDRAKRDLV